MRCSLRGASLRVKNELLLNGKQTITVTGEGVVPQSKAKGVAEFRNLTQSVVTIPMGTVVTAGDVRFVTTEDGRAECRCWRNG